MTFAMEANKEEVLSNLRGLSTYLLGVVAVWLLGACVGLLIPRPKWVANLPQWGFLYTSPAGLLLRKLILLGQFSLIVREIWFYLTPPATFRRLLAACVSGLTGRGWKLAEPEHLKGHGSKRRASSLVTADREGVSWYIGQEDLDFCKSRLESQQAPPGYGEWEEMMSKDFGAFSYQAWRRDMPNGKTEYKSVTVADDATAQEFMDFYLDDPTRPKWDNMISEYEVLESGDGAHRCQVVRWIRTFPFSFLSRREYVIGRREWAAPDGCLYGITRGIQHPRAPALRGIVRMDAFYSMWRSRTIPCLKGTGKPACETVLLHMEEFKIPEKLARFAVRHGMSGFISKLGPAVAEFVAERRKRVSPFESDPDAYGVRDAPNPPPSRTSSVSSLTSEESATARGDVRFASRGPSRSVSRAPSLAQLPVPQGMVRASSVRHLASPLGRCPSARALGAPGSPLGGLCPSASARSLAPGTEKAEEPALTGASAAAPEGRPPRRRKRARRAGALILASAVGAVGFALVQQKREGARQRQGGLQAVQVPVQQTSSMASHRLANISSDGEL